MLFLLRGKPDLATFGEDLTEYPQSGKKEHVVPDTAVSHNQDSSWSVHVLQPVHDLWKPCTAFSIQRDANQDVSVIGEEFSSRKIAVGIVGMSGREMKLVAPNSPSDMATA